MVVVMVGMMIVLVLVVLVVLLMFASSACILRTHTIVKNIYIYTFYAHTPGKTRLDRT